MKKLKACLTFDVDCTNYLEGGIPIDEFGLLLPSIISLLDRKPDLKVTWFVRLDAQIEMLYGKADYFFYRFKAEINELKSMGHEIGWHPHCYVQSDGGWMQNTDASSVLKELSYCANLAVDHGLESVRMGWGFHTNETMYLFAKFGFVVDSSAIPRPAYPWEATKKDWEMTPNVPYFPCKADYRIPGDPALSILEVPISVVNLAAPYDVGNVLRCVNLAYQPNFLQKPLEHWLEENSQLVTVTHPYELFPTRKSDGLIAFNLKAFEQNLTTVHRITEDNGISISFCTLGEFARMHGGGSNAKS